MKNLTYQNNNPGTVSRIKYIVLHDCEYNSALERTNGFKSYGGYSVHYVVDENGIFQSVEDKDIAWHCGAEKYVHSECRNYNSIGIEMCSFKNNKGKVEFKPKTVENTLYLIKELMAKYNISAENVLRHYDVTNDLCPKIYVSDKTWSDLRRKIGVNENENSISR